MRDPASVGFLVVAIRSFGVPVHNLRTRPEWSDEHLRRRIEHQPQPPSSTTKLVESIRQAGPVAYLLIAALLLAVIVAIANSSPSTIDGPAATGTTISGEVAATFALEESDGGSTGSETPGPAELRSVIQDFEQCLRDHGLPVRVRSASETDLVLGYRGDGDLEDILGDPAIEECGDLHLGALDMTITVGDVSAQGGTLGATLPESTDGSTPPTQPTTDTTLP